MNSTMICALGLLLVALVLSFLLMRYESFIGSPDEQRCGVDAAPCKFGESCMNGWCVEAVPPSMPQTTGLPVYP
jgi:hypothetical protein